MLLQYPMGKISDALDRRKAILIVVVLVLVLSILITIPSSQTLYILLIFIIFLWRINVHYLSFKHYLYPRLFTQQNTVAATQGLLLAYSIGSTTGPLSA